MNDDILQAEDGSYIPVGTFGDPVYRFSNRPSFSGEISQFVFSNGCSTVPFGTCDLAGLDFVSSCNATGIGLENHGYVKNCANVVNYIGLVPSFGQAAGCPLGPLSAQQGASRSRSSRERGHGHVGAHQSGHRHARRGQSGPAVTISRWLSGPRRAVCSSTIRPGAA